jgi:hypothetical protein
MLLTFKLLKLGVIMNNLQAPHHIAARIIGLLFIISTSSYIAGNGLMDAATQNLANLVTNQTQLRLGAMLMLLNSVAVIGIGLVIFPILEQHHKTIARIYLTSRIAEGILLAVGVLSLLSLIPMSLNSDTSSLQVLAALAIKNNFFAYQIAMILLGIGSLFFCALLFQTKLIPRFMTAWGFLGYIALLSGAILEIFGFQVGLMFSVLGGLFELTLPIWLLVKGFLILKPK